MEQTEAILTGRSAYGESSLIIQWCGAESGLLKTMAKGATRPKSPFGNRLDLFVSAEIRWVPSRRSDLHVLAEVHLKNPRLGIRQSYGRVLAATYLVKLVDMVAEREAPLPGIHELLSKGLDFLTENEPRPAMVERFEWRLAQDLGIATEQDQGFAGGILEETYHRRLPPQRQQLLQWLRERA